MKGGPADGRMGGWIVAMVVLLLFTHPPIRLCAQSDPRLQEAVRLAQAGRQDSGLAVVRRVLASLPAADSLYPEALYTAGILARDPRSGATNLQRVVVEYGWSPWADDALLWLTQLHFANTDDAATLQSAERLRRDYPDSPLRPRVAFWGARAAFNLKDEARGCALIREALDGSTADVEFSNQVSFYAARCLGAPGATDTTRPGPPGTPVYAVQVLAVKSAALVDETLTRLKAMGFEARVVRDTSGLFKVRVGRYATREEAQRLQARLRARLGGQPFVVEEQ